MTSVKRARGSNFSNDEKMFCLAIISKYSNILENKNSNAVTWKEKEATWEKICEEFNVQSPSKIHRTAESLKKMYENKKRETRKAVAQEKKDLYRTGGGTSSYVLNDPSLDLTLSMMNKKTVEGMINPFDGDSTMDGIQEIEILVEDDVGVKNNQIIPESFEANNLIATTAESSKSNTDSLNWGDYKATHLQTPVSKKLKEASTSESNNSSKWSNRRRPQPTMTSSNIAQQYADLAEIKMELASLELQSQKKRMEREEEEHSLKIISMKLDIEIKQNQLKRLTNISTFNSL